MARFEVHLIAGLGGRMCAGGIAMMEDAIDALPSEADAHWWIHQRTDDVIDAIINRAERMGDPDAIALCGHSWGCKTLADSIPRLGEMGLKVDYLAAIDPTALPPGNKTPMSIPANVRECSEFWASRGWPAMARRRDPSGKGGGMYTNPHEVAHDVYRFESGHVALARHPVVQGTIITDVSRLIVRPIAGKMDGVTSTEPLTTPAAPTTGYDPRGFVYQPPRRNVHTLVWHCTADPEGKDNTVAAIRHYHMTKPKDPFKDIGYHFVVYRDGSIHAGRNNETTGAHVGGYNRGSIGVSYVGGMNRAYTKAKDTRTPEQRAAMLWLTKQITKDTRIKKVRGHNEFPGVAKACPSFSVAKDELGNIPGFKKGDRK